MTSRVDSPLHFSADGRTVRVTGPIVKWDYDEQFAIFTVVISQKTASGETVSAMGKSDRYGTSSSQWDATATVTLAGHRFEPGAAHAFAVATIAMADGPAKSYPWSLDIQLKPAVVGARNQESGG
jgi:hypothetical protein